jgi:hypothetical protein
MGKYTCIHNAKIGQKELCTKRESNSRRVDGNDPGYHYPISAWRDGHLKSLQLQILRPEYQTDSFCDLLSGLRLVTDMSGERRNIELRGHQVAVSLRIAT